MEFFVKLIKVPEIDALITWELFELMVNARHDAGDYWIYEGDEEALEVPVKVVAEGITEGFGDLGDTELIRHCEDIFGIDLSDAEPSWEMLKSHYDRVIRHRT